MEEVRQEAIEQTVSATEKFYNENKKTLWGAVAAVVVIGLGILGDGNNLGFADLLDEYGAKAGKSLYFNAGVCELQLGNFQSAIDYLSKYKTKEPILGARALACKGDAYVGLENYRSAVECFESAVKKADNVFAATYLVKAGLAYEALGDKASALNCYKKVEDSYPQSIEAYEIAKYIARVSE